MVWFTARRLLYLVPTLLIISWIGFGLTQLAPGDPVLESLRMATPSASERPGLSEARYREAAAGLGLDKPLFYASILPAAYPDTLYRVVLPERRRLMLGLLRAYGRREAVEAYLSALDDLEARAAGPAGGGPSAAGPEFPALVDRLQRDFDPGAYPDRIDELRRVLAGLVPEDPRRQAAAAVVGAFDDLRESPARAGLYWPKLVWHGLDNQYHHWLGGYLRGDFGRSYHDGQPVAGKVWSAWSWTLLLNSLAILLAYALAVPIGVWSAVHRGSRGERWVSRVLFALYAMPSFWIASLCLVFFTTPEYGMDWFPTLGPSAWAAPASAWDRFWGQLAYFVLPVFCLTYPALALISRQMRAGMVEALEQEYIRAARARGLSSWQVIWKHGVRNALFPLITLAASILPELLAGSVAIEYIFNIPGMGRLTVDSIFRGDWPVLYAVLLVGALLTVLGLLLADLLYHYADPRVSFRRDGAAMPGRDARTA